MSPVVETDFTYFIFIGYVKTGFPKTIPVVSHCLSPSLEEGENDLRASLIADISSGERMRSKIVPARRMARLPKRAVNGWFLKMKNVSEDARAVTSGLKKAALAFIRIFFRVVTTSAADPVTSDIPRADITPAGPERDIMGLMHSRRTTAAMREKSAGTAYSPRAWNIPVIIVMTERGIKSQKIQPRRVPASL